MTLYNANILSDAYINEAILDPDLPIEYSTNRAQRREDLVRNCHLVCGDKYSTASAIGEIVEVDREAILTYSWSTT